MGMLVEALTFMQNGLRASLGQDEDDTLAPFLPRSIRSEPLKLPLKTNPRQTVHEFVLREAHLRLRLFEQAALVIQKTPGRLHELDIIAEPVLAPKSGVTLLGQGMVLNGRYIDKLAFCYQTG